MSMQYPLADMLTRIRNAQMAKKLTVSMPCSRVKIAVAKVLADEGYIGNWRLLNKKGEDIAENELAVVLLIELKYFQDQAVIKQLNCVSRPGLRQYKGKNDIPLVRNGLGVAIISTSQGVMSDRAARAAGIGGEVLCTVF